MSQQQSQQDRVNREQDYVKEKGHEVKETAKNIKEGNVNAELPSNDRVNHALQHGEASLDRFQSSDRGQQLGGQGHKVIDDLKKVLSDEQSILSQKNEGDLLQNIVRHFWALLQELRHDPSLRETFEEWQSNFTSLMGSGDFTQFFQQAGDLFTSLKDTEEFLDLLSQLIDVLKSTLREKTEQINAEGQQTAAVELHKEESERERARVVDQVKAVLTSLSENDTWRMFVHKGKLLGNKAQAAGEETSDKARQVAYRVKDSVNFNELMEDFRRLLQKLVGNQLSVDPLFEFSRKSIDDIVGNDELAYLLDELQILLNRIVVNPSLLDDDITQQRIENLADRADNTIDKLRADPNVVGLKEESKKVSLAIKNEPASQQFVTDIRTLYHDIASDRDGEILDGDVMKSIRGMVVPLLLEHLNNVPLPAVRDSGKFLGKYEYTIDNMKISLPELIPENIHLRFEMDLDAKPLELEAEAKHTYLYMQASNIQVHLHDANWTFARLTVPRMHDAGIFDVDTTGSGMTIWMKMEVKGDSKSGAHLEMLKSDVRINQNFHITFRESHHNKLYEFMTHVFAGKIKKSVVELMQEKLKLFSSYFNDQLLALIDQARTKSGDYSRLAREKRDLAVHKKEHVMSNVNELKTQSKEALHEYNNKPEAQQSVDGAKSVAKGLIGQASEKVQEKLDDQKLKIEHQKREKELDRMMNEYNATTINPSSTTTTTTSTSTATPGYPTQSL